MKTTTSADRKTVFFSWLITLIIGGGLVLLFRWLPSTGNQSVSLPDQKKQPAKEMNRQIKEEQAQRPLPEDYAKRLVEQSEILVRRDLDERLKRFQEMSRKMLAQKKELLDRIEVRKLSPSAPSDANDTSEARNIPRASAQSLSVQPSLQDIYEVLRQYELEIQRNHLAVNAAKQALSKGLSFPETYRSLALGSSLMPGFDELIRKQTDGAGWERAYGSNASAGLKISSTADLNNYRSLLGEASRQSGLAGTRLEGLFGIPRPAPPGAYSQGGSGSGDGYGDGGLAGVNYDGSKGFSQWSTYQGKKLDEEMVKAQALPGRRFSKSADRQGWLYINTWYMIGPWENYGRDDFAMLHPPEVSIDFDAVYSDGKTGKGLAETDAHPIRMIGDVQFLDGILRWKFMQSESMHNAPPVTASHSTYYAYTELYFNEAATMLVALGTDDSGKIWINGKTVWQDSGSSWYFIDEHIAPFEFQQGWNRVLVRLENGDGAAGFSFLIIPQ